MVNLFTWKRVYHFMETETASWTLAISLQFINPPYVFLSWKKFIHEKQSKLFQVSSKIHSFVIWEMVILIQLMASIKKSKIELFSRFILQRVYHNTGLLLFSLKYLLPIWNILINGNYLTWPKENLNMSKRAGRPYTIWKGWRR